MPQLFYGQWVQQVSGTTRTLNDVFSVTENLVFAVGDNGTILKTTDSGANWVQKISGTSANLRSVYFISDSIGFVIGFNNTLLKTTNGGNTWSQILLAFSPSSNYLNPFSFSCQNENLFFITAGNTIMKTSDGGLNFLTINTQPINNVFNFQFLNENIGFANDENILYKTIDGGANWQVVANNGTIRSFYFINENCGFLNTSSGIYRTVDSAITFDFLNSTTSALNKIFAVSDNLFCGVPVECLLNGNPCNSIKGEITSNGQCNINSFITLRAVHFTNTFVGFGTSFDGKIYKNSAVQLKTKEHNFIKFYTFAPNPTKENFSIAIDNSGMESVNLQINDVFGKKVFYRDYRYQNSIIINTQNYSKGIYFVTVQSGNQQQTEKLILN